METMAKDETIVTLVQQPQIIHYYTELITDIIRHQLKLILEIFRGNKNAYISVFNTMDSAISLLPMSLTSPFFNF